MLKLVIYYMRLFLGWRGSLAYLDAFLKCGPAYDVLQGRHGGKISCADPGTSICIGHKL